MAMGAYPWFFFAADSPAEEGDQESAYVGWSDAIIETLLFSNAQSDEGRIFLFHERIE